ncbi:MAG: hypothetical protein ACXQTS_01260 [Candidatus Methanospirareceae archaeon]
MCEMAKNTTPQKGGVEEGGVSSTHEEESQVKKEEVKKEEEKYIIQVSKAIEGEDSYVPVRKDGKIFVFSTRDNAEESMRRIMQRHPDVLRARVMRVVKRNDNHVLVPEIEISGKEIIKHSESILPEEMKGYVSEEMLQYMDEEELSGIRALIAELVRKKSEIEKFSRIAVQRSSFKKNTEMVKEMEELKKKYTRAKEQLQKAKENWDSAKEAVEDFINRSIAKYPELGNWLRINITGEGQTRIPNRGQGRRRSPEGKKGIILKFLQMHRGEHFKETELIRKIQEAGMGENYSWTQQSTNPRLRAMLSEGLISQDESGRYYLP